MRTWIGSALLTVLVTLAAVALSAQTTEMEKYYMVILRRGPAWTAKATPESTKVSQGHMANIERLTKEGRMVVAGPFDEQSGERALAGILILRAATMEEAKTLTESDPAVKAGRFVYEIAPWWGPKSLRY
jgi:uncharacterized protein YciI